MVEVCKCCGHPLPPDDLEQRLTPMQGRLYQILRRAGTRGVEGRMLMELLYQDDPSGGPESTNIINVMSKNINKRLEAFGLAVQATARGPGGRHRLVKL